MKRQWIKSGFILIFALLLAITGFFALYLKMDGIVSNQFIIFSVITAIFVLSSFLVIRKFLPSSDPLILPLVIALNGIGLVEINRIDYSEVRIWDDYKFAIVNQTIFSLLGVIAMVVLAVVVKDHRKLRRVIYTSMFVGIALLILPLIPGLGLETNGATVWISLGPLGTVQPAEFAKIFLIIFFAGYLTVNRDRLTSVGKKFLGLQLPRIQDMGPLLIVWAISLIVLIFQHDLGTSLLLFGIFISLLFTSTGRVSWAIIGLLLFLGGAFLATKIFTHVSARIEAWQDPFNEVIYNRPYGGSGQIVQGFFALANGGLFGTGIGNGYPSLTPFSNSDFIYSALGEELGLTGLIAILVIYLLLIERAISISLNTNDMFGKLIVCGVGFALSLQIFVVVGGVTGLIPLTGLTLPFIARGGSSIIANYLLVGLLILISARNKHINSDKLLPHNNVKNVLAGGVNG